MLTQAALEALRPELARWNRANKRAREEYAANPMANAGNGSCVRDLPEQDRRSAVLLAAPG